MSFSTPRLVVTGLVAGAVCLLGTPTVAAPVGSVTQAAVARPHSYGSVRSILPPGSIGNVDGQQLVSLGAGQPGGAGFPSLLSGLASPQAFFTTATPSSPPHFADALEPYDALNRANPRALTDASLGRYYKDASLGVPLGDVERTEHPRAGVTIVWDTHGVPHITGKTSGDVAYGAGVAVMESRMFLTDVLRHTGAATMAQFVGPTDADIAQDAAQLAVAPYTPAQLEQQITSLVRRSATARRLVGSIDAYVAGVNATQDRLCPARSATIPLPGGLGSGFGPNCPAEYAALQKAPTPYTRADVVSIASLVGGIFGTGGGGQYTNAIWLQQLQHRFGKVRGRHMYDDLREKNDPEAPVTSPVRSPYGGASHVRPGLPGVALPDLHPKAQVLGTGAIVNADGSLSPPPSGAAGNVGNASTSDPHPTPGRAAPGGRAAVQAESEAIVGSLQRAMSGELVGMSNAILVDAKHSRGSHPTAVMGPQTGYYAPQLLMEEELSGPHVQARGVSFAGTNFVVEIGRGLDYAWSATSPYTDITDTVVQRLCEPGGGRATVESTSYLDARGRCRAMVNYEHTEDSLPTLAGAGSPKSITFLVLRTDHGVVRRRTTVKGRPVAIVTERSTYLHEPDSVLGFVDLDDPSKVHDAHSFMRATAKIQYTFNWFYVDDRDVAYYSSARLPRRSPQTDLDLPRWTGKRFDWRGFEPFARHPHVLNPARGYFANWNNKLAPGFASSSQVYGDGSVYRSRTLEDRVTRLLKRHRATRGQLVGAMIDAATVDVRAAYTLDEVLAVIGTPANAQDRAAVQLLRRWVATGSHRADRRRRGHYVHQAAIALFDTWWDPDGPGGNPAGCSPTCGFSLPKDVLRHGLGGYVNVLPEPLDDHPREHIGSAFNGISWYGYVDKTLRSVLRRPVRGAYSRAYCGTRAQCRTALRASLHRAVRAVLAEQGVTSVRSLTYDKSRDAIASVAGGVVGVRPIDWQNRPTFQEVVRFTSHRAR